MTHPIIARRRAERREKIALAEGYIEAIGRRLQIERAWVVGSVARGDFNVWSDVDVLLVASALPADPLARAELFPDKPVSVQVVAYTPEEFEVELSKGNPLPVEATTVGVPIGTGRDRREEGRQGS